jgi:long-chain fatty acid transport protein
MKKTLSITCGFAALTGSAMGAGFYLPNQDAMATAKGNAFVATADNASAVHYNPAGLTQLEQAEVVAGVYAIELGTEVEHAEGKFHADRQWQAVPSLFFAMPLNDRATAGFGFSSPYGLGSEWGQHTPFRTVVTEAHLIYISATAALGYEITPELSIGASASVNGSRLQLAQGLGVFPNDYLEFEGDGYALSGALGVRWQPSERHAFGLTYNTPTSTELDGEVNSNLLPDGSAEFDFETPARVTAGYSFRPAKGWNIEANIDWLDWDTLNTLQLRADTVPGGGKTIPFHWKSTFIYEIGVSYVTEDGWKFAVGYDYNESAQPDATYNPVVGDADIQYINAGFGRDCGDWSWFVTGQIGWADHTVRGSTPSPAGETVDGDYETFHKAVALSVKRRF